MQAAALPISPNVYRQLAMNKLMPPRISTINLARIKTPTLLRAEILQCLLRHILGSPIVGAERSFFRNEASQCWFCRLGGSPQMQQSQCSILMSFARVVENGRESVNKRLGPDSASDERIDHQAFFSHTYLRHLRQYRFDHFRRHRLELYKRTRCVGSRLISAQREHEFFDQ
jgi:hypothetical protein